MLMMMMLLLMLMMMIDNDHQHQHLQVAMSNRIKGDVLQRVGSQQVQLQIQSQIHEDANKLVDLRAIIVVMIIIKVFICHHECPLLMIMMIFIRIAGSGRFKTRGGEFTTSTRCSTDFF